MNALVLASKLYTPTAVRRHGLSFIDWGLATHPFESRFCRHNLGGSDQVRRRECREVQSSRVERSAVRERKETDKVDKFKVRKRRRKPLPSPDGHVPPSDSRDSRGSPRGKVADKSWSIAVVTMSSLSAEDGDVRGISMQYMH